MFNTLATQQDAPSKTAKELSFGLARCRDDLTQAFQLVFQSYLKAGLVNEKNSGLRLTPHHLLPTGEVLVAKSGDTVTSTLSIFGDGYLGLPIESMYPTEILDLRNQGLRIAEIGSLADQRGSQTRFIETFAKLGRLVAQVAKARNIDGIVAAVHPRHARLYQRVMGFRQIGNLSDCPYANGNPTVALFLKFDEKIGTPLYEQYFGDPIPPSELQQYRWDRETRLHFRRILEKDNLMHPGIQGYYNWAVVTNSLTPSLTNAG